MQAIESFLLDQARPFFESRGFEHLPHLSQFRLTDGDGFRCVIFSISPYDDLTVFEVHLGIRLEVVESLAFPYTNGLPGFSMDSMTLVTPLARLKDRRFERHQLQNEQEAATAWQSIRDFLETEGFAFLDRYRELSAMDELYNKDPIRPLFLVHNQINRCLRGITLARLANREDFRSLVRIYRQQLNLLHAPELAKERYEQLARFLETYSAN